MKKILIVFITFFSFIISIRASTYYSDYSSFSDWSLDSKEKSDLVDVDIDRKYLYYHEDIEGDYYIEDSNPPDYNLVDKNNSKQVTSEWVEVKPKIEKNQIIEERIGYYYKYVRPIRYIVLSNIRGSDNRLIISEIAVFGEETDLDYSITCNLCNSDFNTYVKNSIVNEMNSMIGREGTIIIDLNNYFYINDLVLFLYIHDQGFSEVNIDIDYRYDINGPNYFTVNYIDSLTTTINNPKVLKYEYFNVVQDNPSWTQELFTTTKINNNNYMRVREVTQYRETNTYYYYYKKSREYSSVNNDYYSIKDESKYQDYYRYRTRDKVEIEDNIIIKENEKLEDFIKYSTVDIEIESNIDYAKNGKYYVKYITNFDVIEKEVIVNNKNNELLELIDQYLNEINRLTNELENRKNNQDIDKYIIEINNYKNELDKLSKQLDGNNKIIEDYSKEINNYLLKINELNKELENSKNISDYNKYIEDVNNYNIEISKLNTELINYKQKLDDKEKENNIIKREYENEIINLKMSDNDKIEVKEEIKKENFIPLILLWLLVIIILIFIVIGAKIMKRKTSFVENV